MHLCYINFVLKKDTKSLNGGVNKNIDRQTDRQIDRIMLHFRMKSLRVRCLKQGLGFKLNHNNKE